MKFVTFSCDGVKESVGVCIEDDVLNLTTASDGAPHLASMSQLIASGQQGLNDVASMMEAVKGPAHRVPLASVRLLAPLPKPRKNVFCVGLNYRSHVEQNAIALGQPIELPEVPLFFSKPTTAVIGPGAAICCDERLTQQLDYEVELAVVIGRGGTWIEAGDASRHIFGYTLVNDVSARDLQWRTSQFFYGKGLDTYCPMGPAIVSADEVPSLADLTLELLVNGEVRQREVAGNMLFPPEVAIAELSRGITLEPGDVISLGTPGGCGYQMLPPSFLRPGDIVECRARAIGSLINPVAAPRSEGG